MAKRKAANGAGMIRQRKDGTWEGRYTVPGRTVPKSVYGKTQAEVRKKLTAATAALDDGIYFEPEKATLSKWLDTWLKEYTGHLKPYTVRNYESKIRNHIKPHIGAVKVCDLTPLIIQQLYNLLVRESNLAPKSVRNIHGILHSALETLVDLGTLKLNPTTPSGKRLPRVESKEMHILSDNDLQRFMDVISESQYENLFLVDLFTGMRQGELLGLRWACIDFDKGCITIDKQLYMPSKGGEYSLEPLKNRKTRVIWVAPFVLDALLKERKKQNMNKLQAGSLWNEGNLPGLVFTNELGGHLSHKTVYRQFKRFVKLADVPDVRFHDMRHSYAVASLRAGNDIKTVQENLGHHDAGFTLNQYGHSTDTMKKDGANKLQTYIETVK